MKLRAVTVHSLSSCPGRGGGPAKLVEGAGATSHTPSTTGFAGVERSRVPPFDPPRSGEELDSVTLTAHVSKGTYIRSLARDIALALGTVGHVTMLRRIKAGPFTLETAISLDILRDAAKARAIAQHMLPLTAGLDDIPALPVTPDQATALRQGKVLAGNPRIQGLMLALEGETPVALVNSLGPEIRVVRGFNL